jgi:hypothetical protein
VAEVSLGRWSPRVDRRKMAGSLLGASRKVRVAQSERQNGLQPCDVVRPETRGNEDLRAKSQVSDEMSLQLPLDVD